LANETAVKIATLNINGFGTLQRDHPDNKWGHLYRMMNDQRIGVLMLQETHLTEQRRADLHQMFAGRIKIFHSAHPESPTQKEGVAFVLNKKLVSATGAQAVEVVPGRALQLTLLCRGGDERRMLCIYAPTSDGVAERCNFYQQVLRFYDTHPAVPPPHVMAGDFNNIEDAIDRLPLPEDARDASIEVLDDLKRRLRLMMVDGWQKTHPGAINFTFHRGMGEQATLSRLDRIYVSEDVYRFALRWSINEPGLKTDHSLVSVQITTPHAPVVGTGRPVFPLHLLKSKSLTKKMKERGTQAADELTDLKMGRAQRTPDHNPQTILFRMKTDWMETARTMERETVPKMIAEIEELQRDLEVVHADTQRSDRAKAQDVNALMNQIGQLKAKRYKQQQQRARAKHRLEGESPTKYWVRLHRAQTPRDLIPAFEKEHNPDVRNSGNAILETDAECMAGMARAHHDSIQADGPDVTPPDVRERDIQEVLESLDARLTEEQSANMGSMITYGDCEEALRFAKSGMAPGLDGVQYEVWKTLHARFVEDSRHEGRKTFDVLSIIQAAFEDIQTNGVSEKTSFAQGWMAPIYKEKGELTKIANYRPITLLNSDYKLLSKVLAIRL
ncbi:Endonuclease/exonuclease/phosphatase, partial [Trametes gibbosa]